MLLRLILAVLFVPVAWGVHASHLHVRSAVKVKANANREASVLPPEFVQLMALGHDSLLADLLWLQMIQYYGAAHEQELPPEHLYRYFDAITSLDPDFEAAYVFASYLLADDKEQVKSALKLLDKGEQNMPASWNIPFQAGFLHYVQLKDPLKAADAFQRAGTRPGAPDLPTRLAAQLYKKSNEVERCQLSLRLWMTALEQAPNADLKKRAERHIIETRILCDLMTLRKALKSYMQRQASAVPAPSPSPLRPGQRPPPKPAAPAPPATLQILADAGLIQSVPLDPFGRPYIYRQQGLTVRVQPLPWKPVDLDKTDIGN